MKSTDPHAPPPASRRVDDGANTPPTNVRQLLIELRQLNYFIAVVEAKSISSASNLLRIAQPALSKHLQRLEFDFGQQLLIRHSRGIIPTPAGFLFLEHARNILMRVQNAKDDLHSFTEPPREKVRLGMPQSICNLIGLGLLNRWSQLQPNTILQVADHSSNILTEWVQAGRLDFAIASFPPDGGGIALEPLLDDKMCAVTPPEGQHDAIREIGFAELASKPLILTSSENLSRQLLELTAKYASGELNIVQEMDSLALTLRMVESHLGSTIQPYLVLKKYITSGAANVRLIVEPGMTRRLHLIQAKGRPFADKASDLIAAIKQELHATLGSDQSGMVELY